MIPTRIKRFLIEKGFEKHKNKLLPLFCYVFGGMLSGNMSQRFDKMVQKLKQVESKQGFYGALISEWQPNTMVLDGFEAQSHYYASAFQQPGLSLPEHMMLADVNLYMTDDILCKVDRAAMYASLETRVPFLDRDVLALAASLPKAYKLDGGQGKVLLKAILADEVPKPLFDRPKQGFGVPVAEWMRTHLKDWVYDMLSPQRNGKHGFFNQSVIDKICAQHQAGEHNHEHKLWFLLQFNQWYQSHVVEKAAVA